MGFFFDTQAALAKIENQRGAPATSATPATQKGQNRPHVAEVADVAVAQPEIPKKQSVVDDAAVDAQKSVGGRPMTWTGKVVSLAEWREMSGWEKHGPQGRVWDPIAQEWRGKP